MVRCFVGIVMPEHIRHAAENLQKKLAGFELKCKFVEPENMHICLSFLGEVEEENMGKLKEGLDSIASKYKKFDANVGKVKFIPSESYIRVIVIDVADSSGRLEKLRGDVVRVVGGDSKPPHLTLCRVKRIENKKRLVSEFGKTGCNENFQVDSIQLIKSELSRSGPTYTVLHESRLS